MPARRNPQRQTPEYFVWRGMLGRCHSATNAKFPDYGARGITVCDKWRRVFDAFYRDMGPRPGSRYTIERVNNDGPYAPDNCRWATYVDQANNTRRNRHVWVDGKMMTIAEAARHFDLPQKRLHNYLHGLNDIHRAVARLRAVMASEHHA